MGFQKNNFEHFSCHKTHKSEWRTAVRSNRPGTLSNRNTLTWSPNYRRVQIFYVNHVKYWRNVSLHATTLSYVDINLQRTCTFSHAFQTTHWRGMLRLILMRRTCTGSRILLPAKCSTAYWCPTLGITLQRKRNLATAARRRSKF